MGEQARTLAKAVHLPRHQLNTWSVCYYDRRFPIYYFSLLLPLNHSPLFLRCMNRSPIRREVRGVGHGVVHSTRYDHVTIFHTSRDETRG
jgi:hypothetical protein